MTKNKEFQPQNAHSRNYQNLCVGIQYPNSHLAKSPDMDYCVRMNETLLSSVLRNLESNKGRLREIAAESGVPYSTISKINQGITPNPGVNTVQALADYFSTKKAA